MNDALRQKYIEKFGKKPFGGWSDEKLSSMLEKGEEPQTDETEEQRMREAEIINSRQIRTIESITPMFIEGEPYAIIDNEYIPWQKAEIIFVERKIEALQEQLADLKSKLNS